MKTSEWTHALVAQAGLDPAYVDELVTRAIEEDLAGGVDVTSVATVPSNQVSIARVVTRAAGVVAGLPVAVAVLDAVTDGTVEIDVLHADGDRVGEGEVLITAIADPQVTVIQPPATGSLAAPMPLPAKVLGPIEKVSEQMWPGVPVIPFMLPGATDARRLTEVGIPTYGVSGIFGDRDGGGVHGLNERIRVKSLMDARTFSYRLIKLYADAK